MENVGAVKELCKLTVGEICYITSGSSDILGNVFTIEVGITIVKTFQFI